MSRFHLFRDPDEVGELTRHPAALDLFRVLERLRTAALDEASPWSRAATLRDYARICFWAIRRMEYGFTAAELSRAEEEFGRPLRVLDVGSGVVPLGHWAAGRGHEVEAIDPLAGDLLGLASLDADRFYGSRVGYRVARAENLPYVGESFDVVFCVSVLEHMIPGHDRLALAEIARVLAPGGRLVATFDIAPERARDEGEGKLPVGRRRFAGPFDPVSARRLLQSAATGFEAAEKLPAELDRLTWEDVHAFWRATQEADERRRPLREYLALGVVLERAATPHRPSAAEVAMAEEEGRQALTERLSYFEYHASQRLERLERLEARRGELERELAVMSVDPASGGELRRVESELAKASEDLAGAKAELESGERRLTATLDQLAESRAEVEKYRRRLGRIEAREERLEEEMVLKESELAKASEDLADVKGELEKSGRQQAATLDQLAESRAEVEKYRRRLGRIEAREERLEGAMVLKESELAKASEDLADVKGELEKSGRQQAATRDQLAESRAEAEKYRRELESIEVRGDRLEEALVAKEEVITEQSAALASLESHLESWTMREGGRLKSAVPRRWKRLREWLVHAKPFALARRWCSVRLGVLQHHPPKDLIVPRAYLRPQPLADSPRISMVTPSYNQAGYLPRTLTSVLDQGYPELEYIVMDGASSDGSAEVLERFRDRLEHAESTPDGGQADAINRGFERSTGEIMAYLNSDDLLLPGSLHYVGAYFAAHPEVDAVYGHRVLIDEDDREIGRWVLPQHDDEALSWADYVPQETLFWRRTLWERAGGSMDTSFRFALDWDLLLRFREVGARIVRLPRFLGAFRIHGAQKTSAAIEEVGAVEMARLRRRCHGRAVTHHEIRAGLRGYWLRHIVLHNLYRAGLLRY